jgi:hypothetical protein
MRPVVEDGRGALAGAHLGEIDADPAAAPRDVIGPDPFGAQRPEGGVPDRVRRQTRHVVALEAELGKTDRNVRFAAAERGSQQW